MAANAGFGRRLTQTLGSVKTGIVLLILVGIVAALGTVILQRPSTSPVEMEQKYSPSTLKFMDTVGLTNVYHTWWFIALLGLVALSIIIASIERWPSAWRFYDRPYRKPDSYFRAAHPAKVQFAIRDSETGIAVAEHAMRKLGLPSERVRQDNEVSLYAEKNRYSVLAVYIVHASLLLIFLGGILDGLFGFKGYISLVPGAPATSQIQLSDDSIKNLPFSIRCDGAGQENYTGQFAGMPKRWWSKMSVLENGHEVLHKDISVNDPLIYKGVRFYQSGFGRSDVPKSLLIAYASKSNPENVREMTLDMDGTAQFDGNTVRILKFTSDAYRQDGGEIFEKSKGLGNPAVQLEIKAKDGTTSNVWLLYGEPGRIDSAPYAMQLAGLKLQNFTGLQVSHEPGQWAVWTGCLLMAIGLVVSLYVVHMRFWVVTVADGKGGLTLWVGAAANKKNRESFEEKFQQLAEEIAKELKPAREVVSEKVVAMAAAGR
jgi:cytochrome c biogenesis protein